jgi:hypothetical protein
MVKTKKDVCRTCREAGRTSLEQPVDEYQALTGDVDAYELIQEQMRLVRECIRRCERQLMAQDETGALRNNGVRMDISGEVAKLGKTLALLAKEARQFEIGRSAASVRMTYEEKREAMAEYFELMPPEHKRALLEQLTRSYNDGKKGAKK